MGADLGITESPYIFSLDSVTSFSPKQRSIIAWKSVQKQLFVLGPQIMYSTDLSCSVAGLVNASLYLACRGLLFPETQRAGSTLNCRAWLAKEIIHRAVSFFQAGYSAQYSESSLWQDVTRLHHDYFYHACFLVFSDKEGQVKYWTTDYNLTKLMKNLKICNSDSVVNVYYLFQI